MAQVTFDIPNPVLPRVLDAFAATYGRPETIDGQPNPETKAAFARRMIIMYVKGVTKAHEAMVAADVARVNADAAAEAQIDIT